jgi:undecaprenyl-diphosphatase
VLRPFVRNPCSLAFPAALGSLLILLTICVAIGPDPLPGEAPFVRSLQSWTGWARGTADLIRLTTGTTAAVVVLAVASPLMVRHYGWMAVVPLVVGLLAVLLVQSAFKELVDRPRPDATEVEVLATWTSDAYPSGHALGTTMVCCYFAALVARARPAGRWALLLLLPIPATIAGSLVQGVHWPSDLAGGLLVGALVAWLMLRFTPGPSVSSAV